MTWKDSPLHFFVFKADDIAIFAIEFHADQIEFISFGSVFLMVSLLLDLFQSAIFTCIPIHHLEFQNKNPLFQFDGQIDPAMICGVLRRDVQPKCGKIATKDRRESSRLSPFSAKSWQFILINNGKLSAAATSARNHRWSIPFHISVNYDN
jgi:hypothetical protein